MIQVLSQLGVVYSIPFPELYANLLRLVGALELNFVDLLPLGCVLDISFYEALLVRTLALPALSVLFFALRLLHHHQRDVPSLKAVLEFCRGGLFLVLFLIYPSTSAAIFATFQCEPLDDGTSWLRADLSIDCNRHADQRLKPRSNSFSPCSAAHTFVPLCWDSPTHSWFMWYAVGMALLYPFGTPLFYLYLLRSNKPALDRLRVNQALRVQLIEKHAAEDDYASSQVSRTSRFVPWVISKKVSPLA